jgi:hypothetical protein|tara:strand:+ start:212 stop:580 length:369 start_codon:yes stop_codon:yes gene_type:complete
MKRLFLCILIIPVFLFSQEMKKKQKVLVHVVLLKFKDKADTGLFENESYQYLSAIEGVNNFLFSKNVSPEGKSKGFTHALVMQFNSEFDRDSVYLPHPKHLTFAKKYWVDNVEDFVVYDYWK